MKSLFATVVGLFVAGTLISYGEEAGYVSIFDGKSLEGRKCIQSDLFQVIDGAIVATNTKENPIKDNEEGEFDAAGIIALQIHRGPR